MEKLGINCTQFRVRLDELDNNPPFAYTGHEVWYMGRECIVTMDDMHVGNHKEAVIQLNTTNPKDHIPVYDALEIHYLSPIGIELRTPIRAYSIDRNDGMRLSKEEMLREKYSGLDLPDNFTLGELEELDEWFEEIRYYE